MKIHKLLTNALNRFRTRSMTHPIAFSWNGNSMTVYQNGSKFVMTDIFSGCIMPENKVKGLLLPKEINELVRIQQYIDDNINDLLIAPAEWGYNIYKLNPTGPNPLLVEELRFFSIKGWLPVWLAKLQKEFRIALNNV
jgi:hypothetical protein